MANAAVQKKQTGETPSVVRALWDPFGFMQEMFGWGRAGDGPLFEVKETDDTYVCKVKLQLTLPDQADVAHAKAELENGELTLVVPKAAAAPPEPQPPPRPTGRAMGNGKVTGKVTGSAGRLARPSTRRGR